MNYLVLVEICSMTYLVLVEICSMTYLVLVMPGRLVRWTGHQWSYNFSKRLNIKKHNKEKRISRCRRTVILGWFFLSVIDCIDETKFICSAFHEF